MADASRLLGFAFAAADLLIEINGEGRVALALGAGPAPGLDPARWTGDSLADLLRPDSVADLRAGLAAIAPGTRTPPISLDFACGEGRARRGRFRAFQLPNAAPSVSCAISWEEPARALDGPLPLAMLDARGLLERVHDLMADPDAGETMDVAFVAVPGLAGGAAPQTRASARIEQALRAASVGGASAARLSDERFALVRASDDPTDLADEIRQAGEAEGLVLDAEIAQDRIAEAETGLVVRALRLALDGCLKDGVGVARFGERLKRTVDGAERFKATVRSREFTLNYQPIVDLDTRAVHHFEALTRFGSDSPAAAIRMAEELGLVESFDLAVAEKALRQIRKPGFSRTKLAINVSGKSLGSDSYAEGLLKMAAPEPDVCRRLLVEVTETAALADLDGAERRLSALRQAGIRVCLDDFGVGAASFDYLRKLGVDVVKIDGGFVRELDDGDRSRTLIAHLVNLCADLKLATVAEMIETEDQAAALRDLGVTFGQGWLFGRPTAEPTAPRATTPTFGARRVGEVAGWG